MHDDDFLSQFREAPPPNFARNLYQKLQEQEPMLTTIKPVRVVTMPRRLSPLWLAAAVLLLTLCAGLLIMNTLPEPETTALMPLPQDDDPTATPTPALAATAIPAQVLEAPPVADSLDNFAKIEHVMQTWNNDAPATLSMVLSYYDIERSQAEISRAIRANNEDKSVQPWQIEEYFQTQPTGEPQILAIARPGGNTELIKRLIHHNFPVVLWKAFALTQDGDREWYGHYTLVVSYGFDSIGLYDSFLGANYTEAIMPPAAGQLDGGWEQFNYQFIVFYTADRLAELQAILGDLWEEQAAWERMVMYTQLQVAMGSVTAWDWVNLGTALTHVGRYTEAAAAFKEANKLARFNDYQLPAHLLWYNPTPLEAYYRAGDLETLAEALENLETGLGDPALMEEVPYYRAALLAAQGDTAGALDLLATIPNYAPAVELRAALQDGSYRAPGS